MKSKLVRLGTLAIVLLGVMVFVLSPGPAMAAGTVQFYPTYVPKDAVFDASNHMSGGTAFAVYGQITGAPANTSCTGAKLRLMSLLSGGTADTAFRSWASGTGEWLGDSGAWASFGAITTDAAGNWSGWAYGAMTSSAVYTWLEMRIRCGATNYTTSTRVQVTLMDMSGSGTGGWLEETGTSSRGGRAIAVKNGATLIGLYVIEPNNVSEGYAYADGGYAVAAPACTTCGYSLETWNATSPGTAIGQVNTMGTSGCSNDVTAGNITSLNSCSNPTNVMLSSFAAQTDEPPVMSVLAVLGTLLVIGAGAWRMRTYQL
jgi:hypothetical protein